MAKNLIKEGTVRRWAVLAETSPLVESFIEERAEQFTESEEALEEETIEEDNFDKTGPGPHREGVGKNGEQKGIASNQGKEVKDSPDGKLQIPGTSYAGDHKNKSKSPDKGSTDGGKQLQGQGTVTETQLNEMPMGDDEYEEDEEAPPMGGDVGGAPPPMGGEEPMGAEPPMGGAEGGTDLEGLVAAIAQAISSHTGVEVSVAGSGGEMGGEALPPPPGDDMGAVPPGDDLGAEPPMGDLGGEEEEVVENRFNLEEVDDASFQQEANRRGYAMQEQKVEEDDGAVKQEAMVEAIARQVAKKLAGKTGKRAKK